jgi:hypothetical protein
LNFPDLVTRLVRENGLYAMLLKCLEDFFERCAVWSDRPEVVEGADGEEEPMETETPPEAAASSSASGGSEDSGEASPPMAREGGRGRGRRKVVNLREPILRASKSPWERVVIDLDMAIGLEGTGRLLTLDLPGLFAQWQHILALLHGIPILFIYLYYYYVTNL